MEDGRSGTAAAAAAGSGGRRTTLTPARSAPTVARPGLSAAAVGVRGVLRPDPGRFARADRDRRGRRRRGLVRSGRTSLQLDTDEVLKSVGPRVVRVLATTCAGTGEASGVLIDNGRILTATSAIEAAAVDRGRDARRRGSGAPTCSAPAPTASPSCSRSGSTARRCTCRRRIAEPKAERALVGYTAAGKQVINAIGSTAEPTALGEVLNAAKLGAPGRRQDGRADRPRHRRHRPGQHDRRSRQASPVRRVRRRPASPSEPGGTCDQSHGPQAAIAPMLQVANTPLAVEVQTLLGSYLTLDEPATTSLALRPLYSPAVRPGPDRGAGPGQAPDVVLLQPEAHRGPGRGRVRDARMTYNVLFPPPRPVPTARPAAAWTPSSNWSASKGKLVDRPAPPRCPRRSACDS